MPELAKINQTQFFKKNNFLLKRKLGLKLALLWDASIVYWA